MYPKPPRGEVLQMHLVSGREWPAEAYTGLDGLGDADNQLRHLRQEGITHAATVGFIFIFRNHPDNVAAGSSSYTLHHDHDHVWQGGHR